MYNDDNDKYMYAKLLVTVRKTTVSRLPPFATCVDDGLYIV